MSADIFTRARQLAAQSRGRLTFADALAELGRRGHEARKRGKAGKLGYLRIDADRRISDAVESPRYWYLDR